MVDCVQYIRVVAWDLIIFNRLGGLVVRAADKKVPSEDILFWKYNMFNPQSRLKVKVRVYSQSPIDSLCSPDFTINSFVFFTHIIEITH